MGRHCCGQGGACWQLVAVMITSIESLHADSADEYLHMHYHLSNSPCSAGPGREACVPACLPSCMRDKTCVMRSYISVNPLSRQALLKHSCSSDRPTRTPVHKYTRTRTLSSLCYFFRDGSRHAVVDVLAYLCIYRICGYFAWQHGCTTDRDIRICHRQLEDSYIVIGRD